MSNHVSRSRSLKHQTHYTNYINLLSFINRSVPSYCELRLNNKKFRESFPSLLTFEGWSSTQRNSVISLLYPKRKSVDMLHYMFYLVH